MLGYSRVKWPSATCANFDASAASSVTGFCLSMQTLAFPLSDATRNRDFIDKVSHAGNHLVVVEKKADRPPSAVLKLVARRVKGRRADPATRALHAARAGTSFKLAPARLQSAPSRPMRRACHFDRDKRVHHT
ncbi:hypothetical protein BURKHO8Y_180041 [Burkholderia sp. 8Y]|nr:hypothetical protein BURKHO8Y_180041 [Burkholderia sp. 8Y]